MININGCPPDVRWSITTNDNGTILMLDPYCSIVMIQMIIEQRDNLDDVRFYPFRSYQKVPVPISEQWEEGLNLNELKEYLDYE